MQGGLICAVRSQRIPNFLPLLSLLLLLPLQPVCGFNPIGTRLTSKGRTVNHEGTFLDQRHAGVDENNNNNDNNNNNYGNRDDLEKLHNLLHKAGIHPSDCTIEDLRGDGYCNYMYKVIERSGRERRVGTWNGSILLKKQDASCCQLVSTSKSLWCTSSLSVLRLVVPSHHPFGCLFQLVAKLLSNLAKRRIHPSSIYRVDRLVGSNRLGPTVHATSKDGVLMDWLPGNVLNETILHQSFRHDDDERFSGGSDAFVVQVARKVRALHRELEYPPPPPNILWHSLGVMLSMIDEGVRNGDTSSDDAMATTASMAVHLREQCSLHKNLLESLDLPIVLGHGDMKPSNLMMMMSPETNARKKRPDQKSDGVGTDVPEIMFIDFETSGMHYRGFDIAKIFRTRQPTPSTAINQELFVATYAKSDMDAASVLLEAALLTPMTVRMEHIVGIVQSSRT